MNMKLQSSAASCNNSANIVSKKELFASTATAASSSVTKNNTNNAKRGMQLLLASMAGITTAVGVSACRWLLLETGEVLLLFANNNNQEDMLVSPSTSCIIYDDAYDTTTTNYEGIDSDFVSAEYSSSFQQQCTTTTQSGECETGGNTNIASWNELLARAILATASSPQVRCTPILLLVVSSTAFVIGILLTHQELQQMYHNLQSYRETCTARLKSAMGVATMDELATKLSKRQVRLQKSLGGQIETAINTMDGLVLDDVLRQIVKNGVEITMGVWGGMILYSLPLEEMDCAIMAKRARQRLVRATDPSLERILFCPGGVWNVIPQSLREFLRREVSKNNAIALENHASGEEARDLVSGDDSTVDVTLDNDDDSSDTPLTSSPISSVNVQHDVSSQDEINKSKIPYAKVIRSDESGEEEGGIQNQEKIVDPPPKETVADALSATINELVVSHLMNASGLSSTNNDGEFLHRIKRNSEKHEQPQHNPPTPSQLEKYLHGTASIASFAFLYHLTRSPSTRRAWGSAVKMLTSLGLLSTAVVAGVASAVLTSNSSTYNSIVNNPIVSMLYSKSMHGFGMSPIMNINDKIHTAIRQLHEAIRKDKRLQATIAFFILYGTKSLSGKYRRRIGYPQSNIR